MRRKLIKQDAFDKMTNESVKKAERELVEAESLLAKSLNKDCLTLHSFTEGFVTYKTLDDTFVHAAYEIKDKDVTFKNIEELVIDESSHQAKKKKTISEMVDAILNNEQLKAKNLFNEYMAGVRWSRVKNVNESCKPKKEKKKEKKSKKDFFLKNVKKVGKDLAEAYAVSQNVIDYCDYVKVGPVLMETVYKTDDKGNVTDLRIPTILAKNENKLHKVNWKFLNSKIVENRKQALTLGEDQDFGKSILNLKRQNAFSDVKAIEEALDHIVGSFPDVVYLTQSELSNVISESLNTSGATNYDDDSCVFMAEAILSKACNVYTEKVDQVLRMASAPKNENDNSYLYFQSVVEKFYPSLDEQFSLERSVFTDLYDSLNTVYKKADRQGDDALKNEAASYINELADALNGVIKPEVELANEAAEFLSNIIETNLETGKWVVSNTPHTSTNGDHPEMAKKAGQGYTPSKDGSGDWGDPAPAIGDDDMNYKSGKHAKKMRNDSWGQVGPDSELFPKLKNPYIKSPFGDYTIKGEKGVDKESGDYGKPKSKDVFPDLKNPYLLDSETPNSYKMKNGEGTDLVVGK